MRQRLFIIITLLVVVILLVLLNAASYVKVEQASDSEASPDRSTFNSGPTGTRALYDFLRESGYQVAHWREPMSALLSFTGAKPTTLVIVGDTVVAFEASEATTVLKWVSNGGRLVIIDRSPDQRLLPASGEWAIKTERSRFPPYNLDPNNPELLTSQVKPIAPSQPTLLARNVDNILPSLFAGAITITRSQPKKNTKAGASNSKPTPDDSESEEEPESDREGAENSQVNADTRVSPAPVISFANERGGLLVDYPHGRGRIVLLSDPFIVANNGISRADNLQLAINVVNGPGGLIAFDEFHQGRATTHNALIQYFEGTPVLAICGQLMLIGLAVIWSRSSRFARALPLTQVDRRSSLEFVASMAELQQRAKAHDLALENIYGRVRRVLVRHAGLNNSSPRAEIAARVALRSGLNKSQLETLMKSCEDTINGAPTSAKETLTLVKRLRQLEAKLGLRTRSRDARQAAEEI